MFACATDDVGKITRVVDRFHLIFLDKGRLSPPSYGGYTDSENVKDWLKKKYKKLTNADKPRYHFLH